MLTNAPALYSLAIRERDDVTDILAFLVRKDVYLRKLVLDSCYLGFDGTASLANIVDLYPCLEFLSLKGCSPLSSSAYRLITHLNKLSELNLSDCEVYYVCFEPVETHVCIRVHMLENTNRFMYCIYLSI